jgi:hypothetical protein
VTSEPEPVYYSVGSKLLLNGRWPVRVVGRTSLPDDLVVEWLGMRPLSALAGDRGTVCLNHLDREPEFLEEASR